MHLLSRCSALGPGPGSLPRLSSSSSSQTWRRVPCSHRIWSLAVLHGIAGRRRYSGGEWVHLWGGAFKKEEAVLNRDFKRKEKESTITFLISRTVLRFFFWHSNHALENTIRCLRGAFETKSFGVNRAYHLPEISSV
jgi:hypothetical protein